MVDKELAAELKMRYDSFAESLDERTTASDYQLRELEISLGLEYIRTGDRVVDVGCGLGYAVRKYADNRSAEYVGIDYSDKMIDGAIALTERDPRYRGAKIAFKCASVMKMPLPTDSVDVVTSSRCLMALLDWDLQQEALIEIHRVLRPGGVLVMMEGTNEGLDRLNELRSEFGLGLIEADGKDRLFTKKFDERVLCEFTQPYFTLERIQRFGMYYFLTRIVQPLLVAPMKPSYDHKLNDVAREIALKYPDFMSIGHLVGFILCKRRS